MTYSENISRISKCPECCSISWIEDYEHGEIICQNCGLVINVRIIEKGPEWRAFTQEERESRKRVGPPIFYSTFEKGLYTSIKDINRDVFGKQIIISTKFDMLRSKKWQNKNQSSIEKKIYFEQ